MSLYDRRRSVGAKLLAEMPATIVAMPPPNHRVKPRTCTSSQNPRIEGPSRCRFCDLLTVHDFRNRLPAGISGFEFMPMLRSEEHTSELQSQSNLVCRLLLEKKKKKKEIYLSGKKTKKKQSHRTARCQKTHAEY